MGKKSLDPAASKRDACAGLDNTSFAGAGRSAGRSGSVGFSGLDSFSAIDVATTSASEPDGADGTGRIFFCFLEGAPPGTSGEKASSIAQ
jgi:hypothetical protein